MYITNQTNAGWIIYNGSGWNHHKTADALNAILADSLESLPVVPVGYAVLVAPISDKPLGLRCALVKVLARKMEPFINFHNPAGDYDFATKKSLPEIEDETVDGCSRWLAAAGYLPTHARPEGWPVGDLWYRHQDGRWASVQMLDDGPDGDADDWARDCFDFDVEKIYSVKCEQQSEDDSQYLIRVMAEQIAKL